jgi:hypothetical protein
VHVYTNGEVLDSGFLARVVPVHGVETPEVLAFHGRRRALERLSERSGSMLPEEELRRLGPMFS